MKVVGLISGGKDSTFNLLCAVADGHELVALANLHPDSEEIDELDSYMYQTVGHHAIELYAEAVGLPLFRKTTKGKAHTHERIYIPLEGDEVEDLYQLLADIKNEMQFDAISVGAIMSEYQAARVRNVCERLGVTMIAYLWRQNQELLLREMIASHIEAIIIKVAALGLKPVHLGQKISDMMPHLIAISQEYGCNPCGEGGEYETLVLDCPLFHRKIVLDDVEEITVNNDKVVPVAYLNIRCAHLVSKPDSPACIRERVAPVLDNLQTFVKLTRESQQESKADVPAVAENGRSQATAAEKEAA